MLFELTIIVVNEQPDTDLVELYLATERQRAADQIGTALAQGVVETLDMCGFTRFLANWTMPFQWEHARIGRPEIGVTDGAFAIIGGQRGPECATGFSRTVANGEADHTARLAL